MAGNYACPQGSTGLGAAIPEGAFQGARRREGAEGESGPSGQPQRPGLVAPRPEEVPASLRAIDRWVVWEAVWRHDPGEAAGGKWSKMPYSAATGAHASPADPATWSSFENAVAALDAAQGRYAGLGLVLSHLDRVAVVDLDDALTEDGTLLSEFAPVAHRLDAYAEETPSGRGLRLFLEAHLPPGGRRRGPFGFYEADRIVCVTGARMPGASREVPGRQGEVEEFHAELFPSPPPRPAGAGATPPGTDAALLELAMGGASGTRLRALYHGDFSAGGMDRNGADLALCSLLGFYTGDDPARLDRLFRNSRLFRRKWDEPHYSDGRTYGQAVVQKALEGCLLFYNAPAEARKTDLRKAQRERGAAPTVAARTAEESPMPPSVESAAPTDGALRAAYVVPSVIDTGINPLAVAEAQGRAHGLAMSERVLTANEAAEVLRISPRMLRRSLPAWRRFGNSPSGDRWLLSDLLRGLEG